MIEFTDRYGGPENWPDPDTVCLGMCEGMGVYPHQLDSGEWQFVTCEDCDGTGKRPDHSDGSPSSNQ